MIPVESYYAGIPDPNSTESQAMRAVRALDEIRLCLAQFLGYNIENNPEQLRDAVIFHLDEYRGLQAWANSRPRASACGVFSTAIGTGIPPNAYGIVGT
jgi:hypothetical protein